MRRAERERIRKFYPVVLGCKLTRELDDKDDFRIGDGFHIAFLYASGTGVSADKGVPYAAEDALSDEDLLKAILLELKTDNVEEMRQKFVLKKPFIEVTPTSWTDRHAVKPWTDIA